MNLVKTAKSLSRMATGARKKDKWKKRDIFIGAVMIGVFGCTFGAYSYFTVPSCVCGVIFLLLQRYLHANWQIPPCRWVSGFLRFIAVLWLIFLIPTAYDLGKDKSWLYGVKKKLYLAGNYSDSWILDFMPEKIPDCDDYYARFGPPMAGQDAQGWVKISFRTDAEGIDYLRSQAESHGAEHYDYPPDEDKADTEPYSKLGYYAKNKTDDMIVSEMYTFGESSSRHKSCYLMNAESGQVVINW